MTFKYLPMRLIENQLCISFIHSKLDTIEYQIGAAQAFREYIKQPVIDQCRFEGSSWGAFVAVALVMDLNLTVLLEMIKSINSLNDTRFEFTSIIYQ